MGLLQKCFIASGIFFILTVVQSFSELVVVRHPPTKNGLERKLTCMSEDDGSALIWNDELGKTEQFNPKKFKPERPASNDETQCAVRNSTQCIAEWGYTGYWEVVNTFTDPMGPVFDYRWEGFYEYTFKDSIDHKKYQYVGYTEKSSYTIVFSARGLEDVDILLCRKKNPTEGPCLWITIGTAKNNQWQIQSCDEGPPDDGRSRAPTCTIEGLEENQHDTVIQGDKWQTFRLQWDHKTRSIKVFKELGDDAFVHKSKLKPEIVSHVSVRSGLGTRVRFHSYEYFLTNISGVSLSTKEFEYTDSSICFELLVGLRHGCQLLVYLADETLITETLIRTISGDKTSAKDGLLTWKSIEITQSLQNLYRHRVKLRIHTEGVGLWAIGNFRSLRASTITVRKTQSSVSPNESLWPKIGCQELSYTKNKSVVVDSLGTIREAARTAKQLRDFTRHLSDSCGSQCAKFDEKSSICKRNGCTCGKGYDGVYCDEATECFRVTKITKTSITLDWNRKRKNCSHNEYVVSQRKLPNGGLNRELYAALPHIFENLDSDTAYIIEIETLERKVLYTEEVRTLEAGPGQVQELRVNEVHQTEVTLEWDLPLRLNREITKYIVTLERVSLLGCADRAEATPYEVAHKEETKSPTVHFENLHPYAKYRATVTAYTFEAGNKTSTVFDTTANYYATSVVSDLKFDEKLQRLTWNRPEDCATITGPIWGTSLNFTDLSNPASNKNMIKHTRTNKFDLRSLPSIPFTTYEVCVQVIRNQYQLANSASCTKTQLTTAPIAPPAVTDLTIYDADPGTNRISLRWKPPNPPHGKIESYHVSIEREKDPPKYVTIEGSERKCEMWEDDVCFEDFELERETSIRTKVQVYAKNENVAENGNSTGFVFKPDDYYNEKPGTPLNLNATHRSKGVVILKWNPPSFTATKITQFRIYIEVLDKHLLVEEYSNFPMSVNYTAEKNQKEYNKEVSLLPSTTYRISAAAVNERGNVSEKIPDVSVSVPAAVGFSSIEEPEVKDNGSLIEIKIPEVVNATKETTIKVIVKGLSTCTPRISSNHFNQTMVRQWKTKELEVKEKRSDDPLIINTKQHQGVDLTCSLYREETYRILFVVEDLLTGTSSNDTSSQFTLIDRDQRMQPAWLLPFIGFFAIIAICSILVFVWYLKRRKTSTKSSHQDIIQLESTMTNTGNSSPCNLKLRIPPPTENSVSRGLSSSPDVVPLYDSNSYPVKVEEFEEYTKEALASGLLDEQYKTFAVGDDKSCDYGTLPENAPKNRYKDRLPYDDTRVILQNVEGIPNADYINANYIQGYRKPRAYIATQGPKLKTVKDFWRMIWENEVQVICMLANVMEGGKKKCEQYWPEVGSKSKYGNILIKNEEHKVFADYTYRIFTVGCDGDKRTVTHLHYTGWPDHGVPKYTQSLVTYLKKLLATSSGKGPVVVHCSAGVGRTGTIILCDICLRQAFAERVIDVPSIMIKMREFRAGMVDNAQQYLLAHLAIVECMVVEQTQIPCDDFLPDRITELRKQLANDIKRLKETVWQDRALHSLESKNRLVPASDNNVIKTVSVDGVKIKNQYLSSQLPSSTTLSNLWELISERGIELVIILQRPQKNAKFCDLTLGKSMFDPLPNMIVETKSDIQKRDHFTINSLSLTETTTTAEVRTQPVTVLTCTGWGNGKNGKPPTAAALVMLWIASEKISRKEGTTLVLCHDGVTSSGLYLALSFLLERMAVEKECDVISAVRAVRRSNVEFVKSLQQFQYLYDAAENYVKCFETYANFS